MPRAEVQHPRLPLNSVDKATTLVRELRKLQERVQILEVLCGDLQRRMLEMETELETMAAMVDPDL